MKKQVEETMPVAKFHSADYLSMGVLGLLALVVYGLTCSPGVFPGQSADLMATFSGIEPATLPVHPCWGAIVGWVSKLSFLTLPFRLNLLSVLFTTVSVMLMYAIMSALIRDSITEEYSIDFAPKVSVLSGVISSLAFLFAVPIWQSATRLQYQSFDLMVVLFAGFLLVLHLMKGWRFVLLLFAFLCGAGVVESTNFMMLLPVYLIFLIYVMWRRQSLSMGFITVLSLFFVGGISLYYFFAKAFFAATPDVASLGYQSVLDVMVGVWRSQVYEILAGMPRVGWIILLIMSIVPWLTMIFASYRALNNERSWSQYILHLVLGLITVLGLANAGVSPWGIFRFYGRLPVYSYTMLAMLAGYLVAYWYLMLKVKRPKKGANVSTTTRAAGEWFGLLLTYPMIAVVLIVPLLNLFQCGRSRGAFADRCAEEILNRLAPRTWLVTDGTLDSHLQILAKQRGQELNLLCLQKDMSSRYLKSLENLVKAKKLFVPEVERQMVSTLDLGVLPFIQDWFSQDKEVEKKVAVFGVPDFWYTAGLTPVPDYLFFTGCRDTSIYKTKPLLKDYQAFWKKMDPVLALPRNHRNWTDPVMRLKSELRRHMGFIANNLGVFFEDMGNDKDAYEVYTYIRQTIDPDNVSALFNRFELVRRGAPGVTANKQSVEHEVKDFIGNLKQKYPLWSLSRYYGYIRSPEIFVRLGWGWALSGQTGAALAGIRRAIELLPADQKDNALQAMAAVYALSEDKVKTEAVYKDIIKSDPSNQSALLGLARLAVKEGALDKARTWLEQAAKTDNRKGALGVEWATLYLMNNDLPHARMALQETTDLQPKNLQAWALLAMLQLQQNELSDVERVTLPKMESVAGTVDNYFIQITRAQVALRKGKNFQKNARECFIRASLLRPDITGVKDMILQMDIAMNDQDAALLHARQVLRTNRKHGLANYVMGSLRLQEGEYGEAEDFLRRSVEAGPTAASLNDLAEVLRRIKRLGEAEKFARQSVAMSPELYVAWETLGAILYEEGSKLEEAESCVKKSLALYGDDLRIQITLAKIQLKKGDIEHARATIQKVKAHEGELTKFDQAELNRVASEAASRRSR